MSQSNEEDAAASPAALDGQAKACPTEAPRIAILIGAAAAAVNGLHRLPVAIVTRAIYKGKQKYSVTAADVKDIVKNFRKRQADVVVDYEHSTLAADGTPMPSAGWLKAVDDGADKDGVLWGWAEYTESGARAVAAKDYKYVSPVIEWGKRDKATGEAQGATVTSIALVKQPLFESLPELPLVASEGWEFDRGDVVGKRRNKTVITKVVMAAGAANKVRLVADDGTETEQVVEGLRVVSMADVKRGSDKRWDFSTLPHGEDVLVASDVLRAMGVQDTIDAAIAKGKLIPANREVYERMQVDDLKVLVASARENGAVDLKEHGTGADGVSLSGAAGVQARINAAVDEVRKRDPKMDYARGLKLVASEQPDLIRELRNAQRQGGK
jgi:hypothetical protein